MHYIEKLKNFNKFTEIVFDNKLVQWFIKPLSYFTLVWRFFLTIIFNITLLTISEELNLLIKSYIPPKEKLLIQIVDIFISGGSWLIVVIAFLFSTAIIFLRVLEITYQRKISTRQILKLNEFIDNYQYNKFATPLDINLYGRKEEKADIIDKLRVNNFLIISGKSGIGKSRLAIESIKEFCKDSSYESVCIIRRGADFFEDINSFFNGNKKYVIFLDDVNRIHLALDYLLQLYPEKIVDNKLKIVMTVRDYAKDNIIKLLSDRIFSYVEIKVNQLGKEAIKSIIVNDFNIKNPMYIERIEYLSKGNPRLAVMISKIARDTNDLSSINDISKVYDIYYKAVSEEIDLFNDIELMKVIAIISFYRSIDKSNEIQITQLEEIFSIKIDLFWEKVKQLNELEIVDLYEDEVVKISDQILSTYLFYKVVFLENILDIDIFINSFFLLQNKKLNDVLNPIFNSFDFTFVSEKLKIPFERLKKESQGDFSKEYELVKFFWYLDRTGNLVYIKVLIENLSEEDIENINSEKYADDKILELIKIFSNDYEHYKEVIDLLFMYFDKNEKIYEKFLEVLKNSFGFNRYSYKEDYIIQQYIVDKIIDKVNKNEIIYLNLLYDLGRYYLQTQFQSTESEERSIIIYTFKLVENDALKILRKTIWKILFTLYKKDDKKLIEFILDYRYGWESKTSDVEIWDKEIITEYIYKFFSTNNYLEVKAVIYLCDLWEKYSIPYDESLRNKFKHDYMNIEKVFYLDYGDFYNKDKNIDISESEELIKKEIFNYIENFSIKEFKNLFDVLNELNHLNVNNREPYQLTSNINRLLVVLASKFDEMYYELINHIVNVTYTFKFNEHIIIKSLLELKTKVFVEEFVNNLNDNYKNKFSFAFSAHIKKEDILKKDVDNLLILYREEKNPQNIPYNTGFIVKYWEVDNEIFVKIAQILYDKSEINQNFLHGLDLLFNPYNEANSKLIIYFKSNISLLKSLYLKSDIYSNHFDYNAKTMNEILNIDINFITEYLNNTKEKSFAREYHILWKRDDYEVVFNRIIEHFYENRTDYRLHDKLRLFFNITDHRNEEGSLTKTQIDFLRRFISVNIANNKKIKLIFKEVISQIEEDLRIDFIKQFITQNSDVNIFKELSLEKTSMSWSGSAIPMYQKRLEFFELLLNLFNGIEYLEHRKFIENKIEWKKEEIKKEKKRDFIDDF